MIQMMTTIDPRTIVDTDDILAQYEMKLVASQQQQQPPGSQQQQQQQQSSSSLVSLLTIGGPNHQDPRQTRYRWIEERAVARQLLRPWWKHPISTTSGGSTTTTRGMDTYKLRHRHRRRRQTRSPTLSFREGKDDDNNQSDADDEEEMDEECDMDEMVLDHDTRRRVVLSLAAALDGLEQGHDAVLHFWKVIWQ
jgi:hypothetical protein